jgi:diadenosine tetraphosphate (Ap4A) HIT family hydrolase
VVQSTRYFWIVKNIFPFDVWDTAAVKDHLMLVPKRHVDSLKHFNEDEQTSFAKLVGEYDAQGYALYARPRGSAHKTVAHQHSHLIALDQRKKSLLIFLRKPYLLIHK